MSINVNGVDGGKLQVLISKIERLEEDKKNLSEDIKEVFKEAKMLGYEPKIMREVLKIRKMDQQDLYEKETLIDIYKRALGMIEGEEASEENLANHLA